MNKAAQQLGKLGGKAGTGKAKRRSKAHYKKISKLGAEARKRKYFVEYTDGKFMEIDTVDGKPVAVDGESIGDVKKYVLRQNLKNEKLLAELRRRG